MHSVEVALPGRAYRIDVGAGLLDDAPRVRALVAQRSALIVTDATVGPRYAARVADGLGDVDHAVLELPAGEAHKSLAGVEQVWDALADRGFGRDATVLALGGGVVGDVAGFAAATWNRGIAYAQLPTTLLAMVDSAVGGKTGVNRASGKNAVGAFHQPRGVLADVATLSTLDAAELRAGVGEVIKYAAGFDAGLLGVLERDLDALLARDPAVAAAVVARCCAIKAAVVTADEREAGRRALLNLGHTFGHALEQALGYGRWRHGEAVACGVAMAARASVALGTLGAADAVRIERLVARAGLPVAPPAGCGRAELEPRFARDKKARHGAPRFVVLRGLGHAELVEGLPDAALDAAFRAPEPA
jgi:3-dehydroquinate synthase